VRLLADDLIGTKGVETRRLVLAAAKPDPARDGSSGENHHHGHAHSHKG